MPRFDGTVNRAKPRVNVMRGYTGNEPQSLSRSAPVASGVTIKSGQAIALSGGEWVLADETSPVVYIAYHDSEDTDVLSCGKLMGFSSLGEYELESGWFSTQGQAAATGPDLVIEVSDGTGHDGVTTFSGDGYFTVAGAADAGGSIAIGRTSEATLDLGDSDTLHGGARPLAEDSTADDVNVVRFVTTAS